MIVTTIASNRAMIDVTRPPIAIPDLPLWASPMAEHTMPATDKIRFQKGTQHPRSEKIPMISPAIATLLFFIGIVSYTTALAGWGGYGC